MSNSAETAQRMHDSMPAYYRESPQAIAIMQAQATEIERRRSEARDLLAQMEIGSATWALADYERILNLRTDESKPTHERREAIIARLRGTANTTIKQLKSVAESFYGGEVAIETDYPNYTIYIRFKSNYGVPSNLSDVERAMRDIIPAHLAFVFRFSYLLIRDVSAMTIEDLQTHKLEEFAFVAREDD